MIKLRIVHERHLKVSKIWNHTGWGPVGDETKLLKSSDWSAVLWLSFAIMSLRSKRIMMKLDITHKIVSWCIVSGIRNVVNKFRCLNQVTKQYLNRFFKKYHPIANLAVRPIPSQFQLYGLCKVFLFPKCDTEHFLVDSG